MVNIHEYIRYGDESIDKVKRWIQETHDINEKDEDGQSPLHVAAFENHEKHAKALIKKGANCNFLDSRGWTPLHCAASTFNFNICQLMLQYGKPNVNILTPSGTSALSYLCRTMSDEINQVKTIRMIIKEGAEVDIPNQFGETPLHHACLKGSFGAVKCLIENGANVNLQTTTDKETPIHFAVRAQRADVIDFLVRSGADVNSADKNGKTILEKSIEMKNTELESIIQKLKRDQVPWLELKPNGKWPIPRCHHSSSIYNNRWYLYGGGDCFKTPTTIFSDLYMLNGNTLEWRALKPKGEEFAPPPLFAHSSVALAKTLFIFGGCDHEKHYNDLYSLDLEMMTWHPVTVNGPYVIRPRGGHTATVISDTTFVLFGGFSGPDYFSDVHLFSIESNSWERINTNNKEMAPSKRCYHTASLVGNLLFIFGGTDGQSYFSDMHILDITTWEWSRPAIKGTIPYERCGHSAVVINQSIILIYGGQDADGEILNDIFAFDTESFTWIEYDISISNHRIARAGHTMEILNFTVYTYGGNSLFVLHELLPHILETQAKGITAGVTQKKKSVAKPPLPSRPLTKENSLVGKSKPPYVDQLQTEVKSLIQMIKEHYSPDPQSNIGAKITSIEQLITQNGNSPNQSPSSTPAIPPKPRRSDSIVDANLSVFSTSSSSLLSSSSSLGNKAEKDDFKPPPKPDRPLAPTNPKFSLNLPSKPSPPPKPMSPHSSSVPNSPPLSSRTSVSGGPVIPPKPSNLPKLFDPLLPLKEEEENGVKVRGRTRSLSSQQKHNNNSVNISPRIIDHTLRAPLRECNPRAPSLVIKKDITGEFDDVLLRNQSQSSSGISRGNTRRESIKQGEKYVLPPRPDNPTSHYQLLIARIPKRESHDLSDIKDKKLKFRAEVFNELIETEYAYLKDLCVIIGLYKKPLENEYSGCIMKNHMDTLFMNIEELFEINLQLYSEFLKIERLPSMQQNIGIAFLNVIEGLAKYNLYCSNQVDAIETTKRLVKSNEHFAEFIAMMKAMPESSKQDFHSVTIKPFQRVTRYPLLIKELLGCTAKGSSENVCLTEAKQKIDEIVQAANENKRMIDSVLKMMEIQNSFMWQGEEGQIKWSPDCKYLTEGAFKEFDVKTGRGSKRHFFLFTDMVVIAKPVKSIVPGQTHYKKHSVIPIDHCILWDSKFDSKHAKYAFTLVRTDNTDKMIIAAPSEMEKLNWMNAINDAISKFMADALPKVKGQ